MEILSHLEKTDKNHCISTARLYTPLSSNKAEPPESTMNMYPNEQKCPCSNRHFILKTCTANKRARRVEGGRRETPGPVCSSESPADPVTSWGASHCKQCSWAASVRGQKAGVWEGHFQHSHWGILPGTQVLNRLKFTYWRSSISLLRNIRFYCFEMVFYFRSFEKHWFKLFQKSRPSLPLKTKQKNKSNRLRLEEMSCSITLRKSLKLLRN